MIKEGWAWRDSSFLYTNIEVVKVVRKIPLSNAVYTQYLKYIALVCRSPSKAILQESIAEDRKTVGSICVSSKKSRVLSVTSTMSYGEYTGART